MDDEREQLEVDERVRAALAIDEASTSRVVARALAGENVAAPRGRLIAGVTVLLAAFCAAAIAVLVLSRSRVVVPALDRPSALAITGRGSVLVVKSEDGRRWIVGPPARASAGSYVIVVPE
jgi:hypothetical protein